MLAFGFQHIEQYGFIMESTTDTRLAAALIRLNSNELYAKYIVGYCPTAKAPDANAITVSQYLVEFNADDHFTPPATRTELADYVACLKEEFGLIAEQGVQVSNPNSASMSTQLLLHPINSIEESLEKIEAKIQKNNTAAFHEKAGHILNDAYDHTRKKDSLLNNIHHEKRQLSPSASPDYYTAKCAADISQRLQEQALRLAPLQQQPLSTTDLSEMAAEGRIYSGAEKVSASK